MKIWGCFAWGEGSLDIVLSFTYWQNTVPGAPSVGLTAASSPKRGAKGGASNAPSPNLCREALPLLGSEAAAR